MERKLYLGELIITTELNVRNGEVMFYLGYEHDTRVVHNKCLYDALSDYGIQYDKAKYIVEKCAKTFNSNTLVKLHKCDFYKEPPIKFRKANMT